MCWQSKTVIGNWKPIFLYKVVCLGMPQIQCDLEICVTFPYSSNFPIHYENLPMQYTEIIFALKIENFQLKTFDIFLIFAQNIDCGYTLEPPHRGGSNEYPQSMFWSKNKKNRYTPAYPSFAI